MKKTRLLLLTLFIGFLTNLVWENAQAFLYEGYTGFLAHFMICLVAAVVDALVILLLYFFIAIIYRDIYWIQRWNWKPILLLIVLSGMIAIVFEKWALSRNEWNYTNAMPVVPLLHVGLLPLLQLMVLPVLTFYITSKVLKYFEGNK